MLRPTLLIIPGLGNSGPLHWQSRWQDRDLSMHRLEQADWLTPRRSDWVRALDDAVTAYPAPIILIVHSLGCVTVAHWAAEHPDPSVTARVAHALLVAPADVDTARHNVPEVSDFFPVPRLPLPFPATVVASRTDPYCTFDRAAAFADSWGATLVDAGAAGHINVDSGHGPWPEGLALLEDILETVRL